MIVYDSIGKLTFGFIRLSTIVLLDPTPTEVSYALSTHVFAFCFTGEDESDQVFSESLGAVALDDVSCSRHMPAKSPADLSSYCSIRGPEGYASKHRGAF